MNEFIKQLTSYNLFNYLLPGAIFCVLLREIAGVDFVPSDAFTAFFLFYFAGLTVSRLGSLFVEPLSRYFKIAAHCSYQEYVNASCVDSDTKLISETNNVYRTLSAVPLAIAIYIGGIWIADSLNLSNVVRFVFFLAGISGLYLAAFRKQSKYLVDRVRAINSRNASNPSEEPKE